MEILLYPDPRLREKAEPVDEITDEIREKALTLLTMLEKRGGIGLAAPQVGWGVRIFAVNTTGEEDDSLILVNPEIIETNGTWLMDEGCLSIPGINGKIKRPKEIVVKAQSLDGEEFTVKADGLVARCIMHEYDHLEGILLIDRLSSAKKHAIKKKLKILRQAYELRSEAVATK